MSLEAAVEFPEKQWATDFSKFVCRHSDFLNYATFQEMAYSVHVSTNKRIIFFEVPKNASTSIKTLLHQIEFGDPHYVHSTQKDVHSRSFSPLLSPFQIRDFASMLEQDDVLKFCVFRNPLERLYSGYLDKVIGLSNYHKEIKNSTGTAAAMPPSFGEFLYWIATQRVSDMDSHWKPQVSQSFLDAVPGMRIFSFDRLDELSTALAKHVDDNRFILRRIAPHSTGSKTQFADHYTATSVEMVRRKYAKDFEIWEALNG
jgi:hypothetical protein